MKLATLRTPHGTRAVRLEPDGRIIDLGESDIGALLARTDWSTHARADEASIDDPAPTFAPVIPSPGKIICTGLNYAHHIREMGRDLPEYPTLFAKYAEALIGPTDPIILPPVSEAVDWEAELAVVVGRDVRDADEAEAADAIAGFTILNDVSMRDWQNRTLQWLQGKTFEGSTPVGPALVTPDELPGGTTPRLHLQGRISDEVVQEANTADLVFGPAALISYISSILTLRPGDLIATGTPGGVGHARKPPRYLAESDVLVTEIEHLGRLENPVKAA